MKLMKASVVLLLLATARVLQGADEPAPKSAAKEALRARMAESARTAPPSAPKAAPAPAKPSSPPPADAPATPSAALMPSTISAPAAAAPAVLPQVEVRKGKFSERDYRLAQELNQHDQAIEREQRNLKATETDRALNNAQVSRTLSIFGGNSAVFRQRVAAERVELLEAEKDIVEQIAIAQQPEEKLALQRQLNELRAMRRQLDQTLR